MCSQALTTQGGTHPVVDVRKSVQYVSKHRHFTMVCYVKGISAKHLA